MQVCDTGTFITLEKRFELYEPKTIPHQKTLFECFNLFGSKLQKSLRYTGLNFSTRKYSVYLPSLVFETVWLNHSNIH